MCVVSTELKTNGSCMSNVVGTSLWLPFFLNGFTFKTCLKRLHKSEVELLVVQNLLYLLRTYRGKTHFCVRILMMYVDVCVLCNSCKIADAWEGFANAILST